MTKEFSKELRANVKKALDNQPSMLKDIYLVEEVFGTMTIVHDIVDGLDLDPTVYSSKAIERFNALKPWAQVSVNSPSMTNLEYSIVEVLVLEYLDIMYNSK